MVLIHMNRLRVLAAVVSIVFLFSLVLIPFANADWTMFHADASHSGAGTGNPVLTPTLLWSHTTGGDVESSPAVVNGVVYIGSDDGYVYALGGSPSSSPTPSPTSSQSPTASSSPTIPEFPAIIGVALLLAMTTAIFFKTKKLKKINLE